MKNTIRFASKYTWLFLSEYFILVSWVGYFYFFNHFYEDAFFYVDKSASVIVQLLFITDYYLESILLYGLLAFILLSLHLLILLLLIVYRKNQQNNVIYTKINILTGILSVVGVLVIEYRTLLWPYFLIVSIFAATLVYVIYVLSKPTSEGLTKNYIDQEVIKKTGPFQTKEEAKQYFLEFSDYWMIRFNQQELELIHTIECDETNQFYVTITVIPSINKNNLSLSEENVS